MTDITSEPRGEVKHVASPTLRTSPRALQPLRQRCGRRADPSGGFTLIELLIVVTILPLVIGALALGIVAVFSQQASVTGRLAGSTDLQTMSATFIRDVQSAAVVTDASTPQYCGPTSTSTGPVTQILGLEWSGDGTTVPYQTLVSYVLVVNPNPTVSGFGDLLERYYCTFGISGTPTNEEIVSRNVSTTSPPITTLQCLTGSGVCGSPPIAAAALAQVNITNIVIPLSTSRNPSYVLSASPRNGLGGALTGSPSLSSPVTLLTQACGTVLNVNNNAELWINMKPGMGNGTLTVQSPCAGANAIASSRDSGGSLCVAAILSGSLPLGTFANPTSPRHSTKTCTLQGATQPSSPTSPPWYYVAHFTDPFKTLAPPAGGLPPAHCTNVQGNVWTCPPGAYSAFPSLSDKSVITFTGGAYTFATTVTLPNGASATFDYGTYEFDANGTAFNVSGNNVSIRGTNVLFYVPRGAVNFKNKTNVSLSANPNYLGVTLWIGPLANSCSSSPTLTVANGGNDSYGGIYIPCGEIVNGEGGSLNATFIVAATADFKNKTVVSVGPS